MSCSFFYGTIGCRVRRHSTVYALSNKPQSAMTATPDKYPQGKFKDKACRTCGTTFSPKAPSHLHCSQECADNSLSSQYLKRNYGITLLDYQQMLEQQGHRCAICNGEGFVMKGCHRMKLVVDHCHKTGVVRGLLCHNCNRALGLLKDSTDSLKSATRYLEGATTIP